MSSQPMKRHEENKCTLLTGRSNLKRFHHIWFQIYNTLKKANYEGNKKTSSSQELVGVEEWTDRS